MKTKEFNLSFAWQQLLPALIFGLILLTFSITAASGQDPAKGKTQSIPAPPPPPPPPPAEPGKDQIWVDVDQLPVFKGGDTELLNWVAKNTVYPADAKLKNITGKVIVRFVVEKDCSVTNASVLKCVNPSLDAEALRVVGSLPKFEKPGIKAGLPVRVYFMMPITFALN